MSQNDHAEVFKQERARNNIDPAKLGETVMGYRETFDQFVRYSEFMEKAGKLTPGFSDLSRTKQLAEVMRESMHILTFEDFVPFSEGERQAYETEALNPFQVVGAIGLFMVEPLISLMASEEQKKAWLPMVQNFVWSTCYMQTELSHGSDVSSLQTTAVFDPKTKEFIINTPSIGATKWWPGDLGVFGTHGLVIAQLYTQGKCHGVQPFFVQLRDTETYETLPGIEIGDIGPKLGYGGKDNGFCR